MYFVAVPEQVIFSHSLFEIKLFCMHEYTQIIFFDIMVDIMNISNRLLKKISLDRL